MFLPKTLILTAVLAVANSRSVKDVQTPYKYIIDSNSIIQDDMEDVLSDQPFETVYPIYNLRLKRELLGSVSTNSDGSTNIFGKLPLADKGDNTLSATGSITGANPGGEYSSVGAGLSLDNIDGHGLSLSGQHIPSFGNQLTAAAKVNLLDTHRHNLNANVFTTRNLPSNPRLSGYSTHGGGLDYTYNDKVGASLGVAHTPQFQKTDLSAMGNLNLYRNKDSSIDFNAGATRSFSPFIPKSSWEPKIGLTFTKHF